MYMENWLMLWEAVVIQAVQDYINCKHNSQEYRQARLFLIRLCEDYGWNEERIFESLKKQRELAKTKSKYNRVNPTNKVRGF